MVGKLHPENLRSFGTLTTEERREISRKAGKASVKARRIRGTFKKCIIAIGKTDSPEKVNEIINKFFGTDKIFSNAAAAAAVTYKEAFNGNMAAIDKIAKFDGSMDDTKDAEQEKIRVEIVVQNPELKEAMERAEKYGLTEIKDDGEDD